MGMYTEFHFNSQLKQATPETVIAVLDYMMGKPAHELELPEHELFKTDRWRWMLQSDSYYFDADTSSALRFDDISKNYYLNIRCNLKNYNSEIEKFVNWIMPYLDKENGNFLGFSRYEESEEPDLIYYVSNPGVPL